MSVFSRKLTINVGWAVALLLILTALGYIYYDIHSEKILRTVIIQLQANQQTIIQVLNHNIQQGKLLPLSAPQVQSPSQKPEEKPKEK